MKKKGKKYFYVYKIICLLNGKIYIGRRICYCIPEMDNWYLGSGTLINKAIKKYGRANFSKDILKKCRSNDELNRWEIYFISLFNSTDPNIGYNIQVGGDHSDTISNHPNKEDIIARRSQTWRQNYAFNVDLRIKRKKQLDDARVKRVKGQPSTRRKKIKAVVQLSIDYKFIARYVNAREASDNGFTRNKVCVACNKKFAVYRGFRWAFENDYNDSVIDSIECIDDTPEYVYNLEIEDNHNYYVNGILMHNCDDPQNPKKANSEIERQNTIDRYNETISNRLNQLDIGSRVIIMQRLHNGDLTGYLMDPKHGRPNDHRHICIPAELDREIISPPELADKYRDGLFWPTRFSRLVLDAERKKGSLYFAGQFGQRPVPPEGNLFKKAWFDIVEPEAVKRSAIHSPMKFIIDTALTENEMEGNDPSGLLTCFLHDKCLYIVDFTRVWLEAPQLISFLEKYVKLNGYGNGSAIYIEPKSNGMSIAQMLRAHTNGLSIIDIEGDFLSLRDDKVTRANAVSPVAMARKIKLVKGAWNDSFLTELTSFPKATHDEAVDCLCYAVDQVQSLKKFWAVWA